MLEIKHKGLLVSLLAAAGMIVTSACSFNGASPVSAQSSPVAPSPSAISSSSPAATMGAPAPIANTGRVITVVGTGQASGAPDVATVNIGVETSSNNVQQAVADNRTKMNTLLQVLKGLSIAENDIQTTNYSVYTEQQPSPTGTTPTTPTLTYRVSNQVNVTVRDVSKLGDVLDTVVTNGANTIYGVNFSVADPTKLQGDARAKAMADAKARAESLAGLAGVTLGEVVSVSEVVNTATPMFRTEAAAAGSGGTPIQPGTLDVNMSVQVSYAIQ